MGRYRFFILTVLSIFALNELCHSQIPETTGDDTIRINTTLLNVPVIISDRDGRRIGGLSKDDFVVAQGGNRVSIEFFASSEQAVAVAIVIDTSLSTEGVLSDIKKASADFVRRLRPEDQVMIVTADSSVRIVQKLTTDKSRALSAIKGAFLAEHPGSNANDAIHRVVSKELESVSGRKAIIMLSDGEIGGEVAPKVFEDLLIESDTVVYPIFFQTSSIRDFFVKKKLVSPKDNSISREMLVREWPALMYLSNIAKWTGGKVLIADGSDFAVPFQSILDELKTLYVVGFYPSSQNEGGSGKISVTVNRPGTVVRMKEKIRLKPNPAQLR